MEQDLMKKTAYRLVNLRREILERHPFFGRLLMRLPFGFADCKTAFTDMKRIVFDPAFASRLDDGQLCFVIMHELMHCVLKHCTRGDGKLHYLYNVACDVVVNSIILEAMGISDIEIDGCEAMHLSPDGSEGRNFSAEELYELLLKHTDESFMEKYGVSVFDSHKVWDEVKDDPLIEAIWDSCIKTASKYAGTGSGIPDSMERHIEIINHTPKISWKQILHDFIQNDRCDYVFSKPDVRFSGDFIMPSFQENVYGSKVEKVFFFIDTSASVTDYAVAEAFEEIKDAIEQVENMCGSVMFFDTRVSPPKDFETVEDISRLKPVGGGGTSFHAIFEYLKTLEDEQLPVVIIIMTDGYATFPDEECAMGIPVIWLVIDSQVECPWGNTVCISSEY